MTPRQMRQVEGLTQEDWRYIHFAVQERLQKAKPRKGEPGYPAKLGEQGIRIMLCLDSLAYDPI